VAEDTLNVLFVCTENSSRSIMAEALLNKLGRDHFRGYSAGSHPLGYVSALALEILTETGYDTEPLRSKSWQEFETFQAPRIDAVIMLCDAVQKERSPIWYSNPVTVHWPFVNPDDMQGDEREHRNAFRHFFGDLEQQILKLTGEPLDGVRGAALKARLTAIAP